MKERPNQLPAVADEELARQTQAGSFDAYEQLVLRYEIRVLAFVTQLCGNSTDARELTQDTFVKAFQKIGQFDSRQNFAAWLFTIARRKWIDRHRAAPPTAEDSFPEQSDDADPSELLARREEEENLWRSAREHLGESQFQALWLHYAEDMDVARVAQVLGKTRVHIRVLLFRARQILGEKLRPDPKLSKSLPAMNLHPALATRTHQVLSRPAKVNR